jgi:hypothetical protein
MNTLELTTPPSPSPSSASIDTNLHKLDNLLLQQCAPLFRVALDPDGKRAIDWTFSDGQARAIESLKRFILVLAGWQSGKSEVGPPWLLNEMKAKGPGDYLVVSPTFMLMQKKVLPIFLRLFSHLLNLGYFVGGKNIFLFSDEGCKSLWGYVPDDPPRVLFGHAGDPESLESATIKAAWLDECGQRAFRLGSYEAILGRLSIHQGRVLLTSRPYDLGWMKKLLWDPWEATGRNHPDIDVINFRSIDNPAFPKDEYYRAKESMPPWRFLMNYDGLFTRPAGLIYSSFDEHKHKIPRINIPPEWPRFLGLDFGGVNTAAIFFAEERVGVTPTGRLIAYREYKTGERSAAEHCYHLMKGEPRIPLCAGGSASEGQWRREFAAGGTVAGQRVPGLPIHGPLQTDVEVGIDRVWKTFKQDKLLIFEDLHGVLDELQSYSRTLDEMGEPTEDIEAKETFHYCFVAGTLIATDRGEVPIENVRPGDMVLTRLGFRPVAATGQRHDQPLRELVMSNGRSLIGTPDHPVWVRGNGFVPIDALREYAPLAEQTSSPVRVQAVSEAGRGTVYNLSVSDAHEYFANGVLVSNCDALRYIIGYLNPDKPKATMSRSPIARPGLQNL